MLSRVLDYFNERILNDEASDETSDHALQLAASVLMIEISRADAHVSEEEEQAILKALQSAFNLEQEESEKLILLANERTDEAVSFYEFTRNINDQFSDQEKINLVKMLWDVALADGEIDKYEDYYIRKIADLIYVSPDSFMQMKHKAMEESVAKK